MTQSEYTERLLILIEAGVQNVANLQAAKVDTDGGGEQTFTVGLSPTGQPPATHYWCSWQMTPGERASFINFMEALVNSGRAWIYDGEVVTPAEILAEHGLQTPRSFP